MPQLHIALCIMKSQISVSYRDSGIESIQEFCMGKSHSPANLLHLRRFFLSKEVKTSLDSRTLYPENNKFMSAKIMLNMEKTVQMSDFIPDVVSLPRVKLYVMVFH